MRLFQCLVLVVAIAVSAAAPQAQRGDPALPLTETLARVGDRVEQWYARAQSLVSLESVWIQPLRSDLTAVDFPRRLAYELRLAWDAPADGGELPQANVVRQLLTIHGRPPRPKDEPGCLDPKPVSPEPLSMLLPAQRDDYTFSVAGPARVDGRAALMLDYRSVAAGEPEITYTRDCISISLPGRSRGRIWIDAATYDVLRLDERLTGIHEAFQMASDRGAGIAKVRDPHGSIDEDSTPLLFRGHGGSSSCRPEGSSRQAP